MIVTWLEGVNKLKAGVWDTLYYIHSSEYCWVTRGELIIFCTKDCEVISRDNMSTYSNYQLFSNIKENIDNVCTLGNSAE